MIAVIEASNLASDEMNPAAVVSVQGPVATSDQRTKAVSQARNPFWNEKFVFGVEEQHVNSTLIHAHIVSNGGAVAQIASVSVASLLKGQKMSLPTINNGADIFCVDGWFDARPTPLRPTPTSNHLILSPQTEHPYTNFLGG